MSFDHALKLDENHVNALFSRGACYNKAGNFVKSIEDYNLAIEKDSKNFHRKTSYKNLDKVLDIATNEYNTIPSSIINVIYILLRPKQIMTSLNRCSFLKTVP